MEQLENIDELTTILINKFGKKAQCYQCCEELSELQKELLKYANRNYRNRTEILEEYVDNLIMLLQIKKMFMFKKEEINEMLDIKIRKIKEMLKNGD